MKTQGAFVCLLAVIGWVSCHGYGYYGRGSRYPYGSHQQQQPSQQNNYYYPYPPPNQPNPNQPLQPLPTQPGQTIPNPPLQNNLPGGTGTAVQDNRHNSTQKQNQSINITIPRQNNNNNNQQNPTNPTDPNNPNAQPPNNNQNTGVLAEGTNVAVTQNQDQSSQGTGNPQSNTQEQGQQINVN